MTRQYKTPSVNQDWAQSRSTDMAIAVAIHAISTDDRSPEAIWDAPIGGEYEQVLAAVAEYVANGDFSSGPFYWGDEHIGSF